MPAENKEVSKLINLRAVRRTCAISSDLDIDLKRCTYIYYTASGFDQVGNVAAEEVIGSFDSRSTYGGHWIEEEQPLPDSPIAVVVDISSNIANALTINGDNDVCSSAIEEFGEGDESEIDPAALIDLVLKAEAIENDDETADQVVCESEPGPEDEITEEQPVTAEDEETQTAPVC